MGFKNAKNSKNTEINTKNTGNNHKNTENHKKMRKNRPRNASFDGKDDSANFSRPCQRNWCEKMPFLYTILIKIDGNLMEI
jgi:hypothetical protein